MARACAPACRESSRLRSLSLSALAREEAAARALAALCAALTALGRAGKHVTGGEAKGGTDGPVATVVPTGDPARGGHTNERCPSGAARCRLLRWSGQGCGAKPLLIAEESLRYKVPVEPSALIT